MKKHIKGMRVFLAFLLLLTAVSCGAKPITMDRAEIVQAMDVAAIPVTPKTLPDDTASDETAAETKIAPKTSVNTDWITPSQTTAATKKPVETKSVTVLAVGDNIIHEAVYKDAQKRAKGTEAEYDFVPMYDPVAAKIAGADIAFVNQETPMAGKDMGISGYPTFNSPREAGQALVDVGFDVLNLATNHILDKRVSGARATVEYVQSLPVTELGCYLDEEDESNLRITEVNGIRIAWLSYCYGSNNPYNAAKDNVILPLLSDEATMRAQIQDAATQADFVIVSAHWGTEDQASVTSTVKHSAEVIAEAGADIIIGHHPHIIQNVEWRANKNGTKTLIAYSLGNFLSTQLYSRNMVGGMFSFTLSKDSNGTCSISNPLFEPTVTHYSSNRDGLQIYMLSDYTQELAAAHGCLANSKDFSYDWAVSFVKSIVSKEFLPDYLK